ncbi:MAG: HAD family phosphatase [Muribaculaceae bacterium]|nr:HAD family phosphatase [Muribaculaceae bacterium]
MIKNIVFDLGGVIFKIDKNQAIRRFNEVGFADAASYLDSFAQVGIFGDLESGKITAEQFRCQLSELAGKEMTLEDCAYGWQGYAVEVSQRNLDKLIELRQRGFRLSLLSNTNPFMMQWVLSSAFDGRGHGLDHYFDALYLSYEMGIMKPESRIFKMMLEKENAKPEETVFIDDSAHNTEVAASLGIHVLQPDNGADWHGMLEDLISRCNSQE